MFLKEERLREIVTSLLSEDLKFNGPYNDDFNIKGVDENQDIIDLTENQSVKVYRFSSILEALTNPARQNIAAWNMVPDKCLKTEGLDQQTCPGQCHPVLGITKKVASWMP